MGDITQVFGILPIFHISASSQSAINQFLKQVTRTLFQILILEIIIFNCMLVSLFDCFLMSLPLRVINRSMIVAFSSHTHLLLAIV